MVCPSSDSTKDGQWKILFQMRIENKGNGRAENWRVWFTPRDDSASVSLDPAMAGKEAYWKDPLSGRCETILDEKTRVHDFAIQPHETHPLPGCHAIELKGKPSSVEISLKLNADYMETSYWVWIITIDWETRKVLWEERTSSELEYDDVSKAIIAVNFIRKLLSFLRWY